MLTMRQPAIEFDPATADNSRVSKLAFTQAGAPERVNGFATPGLIHSVCIRFLSGSFFFLGG